MFLRLYETTLTRLKKYATLLPNKWLAKTPQTLASRRLGRQSAERERISEINWNFFKRKDYRQTRFSLNLSTV
ncbi:hypothetical protein M3699_25210 [Peribacillus simplex]|uniref:hypothetical protein n=1 Tax=Peribacillus simplex TaxID=1478 RepID=UPI00203BB085|nr:hypothetical protein [Peribacillus simplex]MCM3677030.1 hypothetical protein [Peribacillus simplex]